MIYIVIGTAVIVGFLIGLTTLSVIFLAKKVTNELKARSVELLSPYDFKLEEKAKEIEKKKEELENSKFKLEQAENNYDLESAARLRHGIIPTLEKEIEELKQISNKSSMLTDIVDEEDIASIISKWTNIPVSKLDITFEKAGNKRLMAKFANLEIL